MKKKILALFFCLTFLAFPAYAAEDAAPAEPPQETEVTQTPVDAENAEAAQDTDTSDKAEVPDEDTVDEPSSPFMRSLLYEGTFSDLTAEDGYYESIAALYEYGLAKGRNDGTFGAADDVTVAEILTFAARIRSTYELGDAEAGAASVELAEDAPWHAGYVEYLRAAGVIADEFDGLYAAAATRAQVAHVLANVLDESWFDARNAAVVTDGYATRQYITDVDYYTPYQPDILALYRRGVVQGFDEKGSFLPGQPITRGEAAAMLTRVIDPALRLNIAWVILP